MSVDSKEVQRRKVPFLKVAIPVALLWISGCQFGAGFPDHIVFGFFSSLGSFLIAISQLWPVIEMTLANAKEKQVSLDEKEIE